MIPVSVPPIPLFRILLPLWSARYQRSGLWGCSHCWLVPRWNPLNIHTGTVVYESSLLEPKRKNGSTARFRSLKMKLGSGSRKKMTRIHHITTNSHQSKAQVLYTLLHEWILGGNPIRKWWFWFSRTNLIIVLMTDDLSVVSTSMFILGTRSARIFFAAKGSKMMNSQQILEQEPTPEQD